MKIMVCTDGSQISTWAVQKAARMSKLIEDAEVSLVHVHQNQLVGAPVVAPHLAVEIPPDLQEEMRKHSRLILEEAEKILKGEEVAHKAHLLEGIPSGSILDFIDEHDIDLVILGNKGQTGLERVFMGSVTATVVQHAECDVYVAKTKP